MFKDGTCLRLCGAALDPTHGDKLERGSCVLASFKFRCNLFGGFREVENVKSLQMGNERTDQGHRVITIATWSLQLRFVKKWSYTKSKKIWNASHEKNSKWKYIFPPGIEPATPCFPACRSNHSSIETVDDFLFKRLVYFLRYHQSTRVVRYVRNWFWLDVYWTQRRRRRGGGIGDTCPRSFKGGGHKWVCAPPR